MKKIVTLFLTLILAFSLTACGEQEPPAPDMSPEESAAETCRIVEESLNFAESQMGRFPEILADENYEAKNIIAYCDTAMEFLAGLLDDIEEVPDASNAEEYIEAAKAYISNVYRFAYELQLYVETGETENQQNMAMCILYDPTYAADCTAAGINYLTDAGFSAEQIAEMVVSRGE